MSGKVVNVEYGFSGKLINGNRIPQISFIDPETASSTTPKNKPQAAVQSGLGKPPAAAKKLFGRRSRDLRERIRRRSAERGQ